MNASSSARNHIHCPQCSNFIKIVETSDGMISGRCPVCKSLVSVKQKKNKKTIRITKYSI